MSEGTVDTPYAGEGLLDGPDFAEPMRGLAARLRLPLPARTRLLLELRDDLEGMAATLVEQGMSPADARRRAAETLLPDARALGALERLSTPWYRKATATLDPLRLRRLERGALAAATSALLCLEAWTLLRAGLLGDPSPFLWPVLALGAVTLAGVAGKAFELWVKGTDDRPRRGLTAVAVAAGLTLALGFAGTLLDLVALASIIEGAPDRAPVLVTRWLIRDAALLSTAIILGVAGGLGWQVLAGWATHAEHAHEEALASVTPPHTKETSP